MSVEIAPHRGDVTTRALVEAALGASAGSGPSAGSGAVVVDPDGSVATVATVKGGVSVGFSSRDDYSAGDVRTTTGGTSFTLRGRPVALRLVGERHVVPATAAIAAAVEAGVRLDEAIARVQTVESTEPDNLATRVAADGVLVIDDSFDTTFRSTVEALKTVAEIAGEDRRSIAVLGPLDAASVDPIETRDEHDRLGRIVVRLNIGQLIVIGDADGGSGRHLNMAAGLEGSWDGESLLVADADAAYDVLRAEIREGDVVLVKVPALAARLSDALSGVAS